MLSLSQYIWLIYLNDSKRAKTWPTKLKGELLVYLCISACALSPGLFIYTYYGDFLDEKFFGAFSFIFILGLLYLIPKILVIDKIDNYCVKKFNRIYKRKRSNLTNQT